MRQCVVFEEINEAFSTQTCSCCGVIPASSPKGRASLRIRAWICSECGAIHDRDINARRIKKAQQREFLCWAFECLGCTKQKIQLANRSNWILFILLLNCLVPGTGIEPVQPFQADGF